jgi:hypothetical protein
MIKLIAIAGFALAVASSAEAMTVAPIGCGPFRTRVGGVCVARTTIRHYRRVARRCADFFNIL